MGDDTPAFLTDQRRAVLNGDYDGEAKTERTHKSRIRARSKTALDELTEVARSEAIDNADVFEPGAVAALLTAILSPPHATITPRWNYDGSDAEYREQYDHQIATMLRLDFVADGYRDQLLQREEPRSVDRDGFGGERE